MLASLTGDVGVVSQAMNGVPVLGRQLGDSRLRSGLPGLAFAEPAARRAWCSGCLGMASYWYSSPVRAAVRPPRARGAGRLFSSASEELIEGVKELKMHHARRREFVDDVLQPAEMVGPATANSSAIA